jgi:uncharacterized phage-associated protein
MIRCMSSISAHDVAAELRSRLPDVGETKLHKLLYYCQGIHLAHTGQPLFDETISAWDRGPVVGTLWRQEAEEGKAAGDRMSLTGAELGTVCYVISTYGKLSGGDLSRLTHNEDPWKRGDAERKRGATSSAKIRIEWIREWFESAGREVDEDDDQLDPDLVRQWLAQVADEPAPRPGRPATRESLEAWARRVA